MAVLLSEAVLYLATVIMIPFYISQCGLEFSRPMNYASGRVVVVVVVAVAGGCGRVL